MSFRRRALFLAGLFVAVSCSDAGNPAGPDRPIEPRPKPQDVLQALDCTADVVAGTLSCVPDGPAMGAASGLIVGGSNGYNVLLESANFDNPADLSVEDTYAFDVRVTNRIVQPLGTTDGVTAHMDSVRIFFSDEPAATARANAALPAPVSVQNGRGPMAFMAAPVPYFQYEAPLANNQASAWQRWEFTVQNVQSFHFKVMISAQVQYPQGWIEINPDGALMEETAVDTFTATIRNAIGRGIPMAQASWSSSDPAALSLVALNDSMVAVTATDEGQVWLKATTIGSVAPDSVLVVINNKPIITPDSIDGLMNVTDSIAAPRLLNNVTAGDGTIVPETVTTSEGGTARIYADGGFTYLSKAGFFGKDTITYQVNDGTYTVLGKVVVQVAQSNFWYVQQGATGDGRDRFPAGSLAQVQDSAAAGDSILVLLPADNVSPLAGSITLENGQGLIGQGIAASIIRPLNGHNVTILAAGDAPGIQAATGIAVALGQDNVIEGLGITASAGTGIAGASFTTLRTRRLGVGATGGPALNLASGTLDAEFLTLSSTSSAGNGLSLTQVDGTLTSTGGAINGATTGGIAVNGGAVDVAYGGSVTQGVSAPLLNVFGSHTGDLSFTGTLSATAGTGLQFNAAGGTSYAFTGTTTLNGGDAGVDISNGSTGTFNFGPLTTITSPSGTAFSVYGSTATVTYSGSITQANNAALVDVSEQGPAGTVTFPVGSTLSATNGGGIMLSNADGTVSFNGTTTLNGGDAGVDLVSNANGTFNFSATTSITNPTGAGLNVSASAPANLTFAGSIAANANRPVAIDGGCGSITVTGAVSSTGQGILVQNCASGAVAFNGSKTLNTGANQAVALASNGTATVSFGGGNLAINTTTGTGFGATGGGTVQVAADVINTISTGTGTGLSLNGVGTGSGVTFRSVSTGAAANGIALTNLSGAGVTVTGTGAAGSGGTIAGTTGHGVSLTTLGSLTTGVTLSNLDVTTGAPGISAVFGSAFGTLAFTGNTLSSTGGPAVNLSTGTVSGTIASLSSSGSTTTGASFTTVAGTLNVTGGALAGGPGGALTVSGGTLAGSIGASLSQATAGAPLLTIAGGHNTGTLTFTNTVSATNGTGVQFTDADGTYTFTGNFSLNGSGDEGIDIAAASSGTVNVTPAGGNTAAITSPSGIAIAVLGGSADLNYSGNVTQATAQPLLSVSGGHTGDLAFSSGTVSATNGSGLQFDNADGTYAFSGTVTLNGGDAGIDVTNGSAGTFTFPTTSAITSPNAGNLISILNSAPSFTYSGGLTKANNNVAGINIQSNTGGTIVFNGDATTLDGDPADVARTISSGNGQGVNFASNAAGTSLVFSGGGLNITSGSGAGFTASNGGTVQITGAGNTVNSTAGGTAVNIQDVTIGASGVSLLSVSASGGGGGVVLRNTGSNGLQVTGGSTHGSGGTVANAAGGDGAIAGNGVYLENAQNVSLSWMNFSGHANHAVRGITATNVTLTRLRITGANGNNAGFDEGSIVFTNLLGSASITSSYIEGGFEDNVRVANTTGTLNRLTMTSDTIGHNGASGNDGVLLDASSTATLNVTVQNSRFTGSRSNNVHYVLNNDAAGDFVFNNNAVTNNHPNKLGSDFGINVGSTSNGAMTYTISGNSVRDAGGSGIEVAHLAGGSGAMTGSITGNTVGVAGVANSGSVASSTIVAGIVGAGTTATHNTTITGNTLRQYTNYGIRLINRGTGNGYLNAVVKTNNIAEPSPNAAAFSAYSGIRAELGSLSGHDGRTCLDISGNTLFQTGSSTQADLRIFGRFSTRTSLLGLGQGGASAVPNTFLQNQNTITVAPGGFGAVNATSTNAFQSSCPPV